MACLSSALGVIEALLNRCDKVLIGGAMAFTFLLAMRTRVGDSLVQPELVEECNRLLETGRVEIPTDFVIAQDVSADADPNTGADCFDPTTFDTNLPGILGAGASVFDLTNPKSFAPISALTLVVGGASASSAAARAVALAAIRKGYWRRLLHARRTRPRSCRS